MSANAAAARAPLIRVEDATDQRSDRVVPASAVPSSWCATATRGSGDMVWGMLLNERVSNGVDHRMRLAVEDTQDPWTALPAINP
jgi:hypothetical protein